ncbi:hypothetical protein C5167_039316 [Papaver somniferum]|uniref:BHLH domain-containing protein n=1 Tax=Papaver somniferum TaxID=3469 RepID=A0A4Y7IF32_PAPSO|nr:transcription factor bHLH112-like isoform X1 [Papaver somniferum]RZC46370.1 hypothetical protein C5167_039316 [Papaver somniferum]
MAEEFQQSGICSGNLWNSDRINGSNSLPFSTGTNDVGFNSYVGSWRHNNTTTDHHHHHYPISSLEMNKTRSSTDESGGTSLSGSSSIVYQDIQKPQESDSVGHEGGGNSSDSILMDSTLQMMGFSLSSSSVPSLDWNNQNYLSNNNRSRNGRADEGDDDQVLKDWSNDLKSFNSCGGSGGEDSSSTITSLKQINNGFALDEQQQQPQSSDCTVTCEGLPTSFPINSSTLYGCPTTLLQGLFEPDHNLPPPSGASYPDENRTMDFNNPSLTNYIMNSSNDLSSNNTTWQKFSHQFLKTTTSPPQLQPTSNNQSLYFSNDAPFWNASAASMTNDRSSFLPSSQQIQLLTSSFEENKPYPSNHTVKPKKSEEVRDSSSALKKSNNEPSFKRPRIETPLPTFKVRKEKLGDRITALQQLVSPFGKTDTASVLFEAIEYIKFLHDQVSVLSAPYLKNCSAHIQHHHKNSNKSRDHNGQGNRNYHQQDLRSRGLCLVPISSTFPVTNETATDFWTPTFGGTYR